MKLIVKRGVIALVIAGVIPALSIPANAFSGGVTTVYTRPTATTVQQARTAAATTPELNQTYQRTMRKAQTAAVAAKAASGIVKSLVGISTIIALTQLAIDLKGIWGKDATGNNTLSAPDPASCSVGPCYQWANQQWGGTVDKWFSSVGAACALSASVSGYTLSGTSGNMCYFENMGGIGLSQRTVDPVPAVQKIFTDVEVEGLLNTGNRLPVLLDELDRKGIQIPWDVAEVEDMPQPIVISPVTVTRPDGSKTITQTTLEPYRATNNDVQWRKNETVTEVSKPAADGTTTSTTGTTKTETGKSSVAEKPPEAPATDTPLPGPPKLYTKKYPDGLTGVWAAQRALMVATPLFTLAKGLMPSVAMSGSCPTMPINLTFSTWANFGTKDVAPPCEVWDWGKAITIVSALLLARSLIFGG